MNPKHLNFGGGWRRHGTPLACSCGAPPVSVVSKEAHPRRSPRVSGGSDGNRKFAERRIRETRAESTDAPWCRPALGWLGTSEGVSPGHHRAARGDAIEGI